MKFLTKEIEKRLKNYPLYSQDGKGREMVAVAKFFFPAGRWTWYICEADLENDEWFGLVIGDESELGYGTFSELQNLKNNVKILGMTVPMGVERDMCFEPQKLCDISDPDVKEYLNHYFPN